MNRRMPGNYRTVPSHGATVLRPRRNPEKRYALLGRLVVALLGMGVTVLAGLGLVDAYQEVNTRRIATVQIEGELNFISESELKQVVGGFVTSSLMAVDLALLKQELETLPWISTVDVRREWPDQLVIRVDEEQAIARWGDQQLLNQQGQVFSPQTLVGQMQLPQLTGPKASEQAVMRQYLQFNQLLYPLGVRIRDLALNDRGAWTLTLTNGVVVRLGRDAVLERLRRLVAFLESEHSQQLMGMASIDLRYRNGLAVAPRPEAAQESGDKVAALSP
jgi:cell division protein FtsQ